MKWEKTFREKGLLPANLPAVTSPFVVIPRSPSVNNLYITRGKFRVKSPAYRAWLELVVPLLTALPKPERFPVRVVVTLIEKVHRGMDGDNAIKSVIDSCVKAGVFPNDNLKYITAVEFAYRPAPGMTGVRVEWRYDE